ncbi:MAG: DUF3224 domain-containing protein [Anaerolineae bacterium]|jgi:hypothetical protein
MKKVLVVAVVLVVALSALSTSVFAGPPVHAEGSFAYVPVIVDMKLADGNTFLYGTDTAVWEGAFEGTSTEVFKVVVHSSGFAFYEGLASFEGSVGGKEGTLQIRFVGKQADPLAPWLGTWRIIGGGGELSNLHGKGTFSNPAPLNIDYEGRIHFDPSDD